MTSSVLRDFNEIIEQSFYETRDWSTHCRCDINPIYTFFLATIDVENPIFPGAQH